MTKFSRGLAIIFTVLLSFGLIPTALADNPNAIVQDAVRFYFADIPVMIDIAKCESGYRQYNADGSAMHDASGTYVGIFQISEDLHTPRASSMGYDIRNIDGNLAYARYLYTTSGTGPWKGCVPAGQAGVPTSPIPVAVSESAVVPAGQVTVNLRMGVTNPQMLIVQKLLNANGFVIAAAGPGSPGSETNYFGSLTREALRKFQCAKQIVCEGNEGTTGYGRIGPATRAALNSL